MKTKRCRYKAAAVETTAILLRRLASPTRWCDLETIFGRSRSALSELFLETLEHAHKFLSKYQNHFRSGLVERRAALYSQKIREKGAPLNRCIGFIDGTAVRIARPVRGQKSCYSGHKRTHALKYQSVIGPDGLFLHVWGPLEGRRHDMTLYRRSGMDQLLEEALYMEGVQYYLYGDPAYVLRPWLQKGFRGVGLTPDMTAFNRRMSSLREAVEWGYKEIKLVFAANDNPRQMRVLKTPIGRVGLVSFGLANIRCCLYGPQTGDNFLYKPPSLEEYLSFQALDGGFEEETLLT